MRPILTSSWDDGHPLDMRLAEMLHRHGFGATFFIPLSNREGLPVMTGEQLRALQLSGFEVGSHTLDHCYLTTVDDSTAASQIVRGKAELEQILGRPVPGFCYPGGKYRMSHMEQVRRAGFRYARNTENFHLRPGPNPYALPVTLQLYPHSRNVYLRNFVRHVSSRRVGMLGAAISRSTLRERLRHTLDVTCAQGGIFHLWGHSWEMEQFGGWAELEDFLRYAAERIPQEDRLSNVSLLRRLAMIPCED